MARANVITVRMTDEGLALVDEIAAEEERTRSNMCRVLIAEAVAARKAAKEKAAKRRG